MWISLFFLCVYVWLVLSLSVDRHFFMCVITCGLSFTYVWMITVSVCVGTCGLSFHWVQIVTFLCVSLHVWVVLLLRVDSHCFCVGRYVWVFLCPFISTFLTKYIQLSYLPSIKWFDLPASVSCPAYRKVNGKECLPLVSVSKGCTTLFINLKWPSRELKT